MRKNLAIASAAATVIGLIGHAQAAYTTVDSFIGGTLTGTNFNWSTGANWSLGTPPTGTNLVTYNPAAAITPQLVDVSTTAYGLNLAPATGSATTVINGSTGAVLTLLSQDSVFDATAKTSPAIYLTSTAETDLNMPIQLGDATTTSGTSFFVNNGGNGNSVMINNTISQAAGQVWGVTIGGNAEIRFRGSSNSGNYVLNRQTYTGKLTVLGSTAPGTVASPTLRLVNSVNPYGIGLPNYQVDGQLNRGTNAGAVVYNAVDGAGILGRAAGAITVIGANNGDGSFTGNIAGSQTIYKVGTGTQSLGTGISTATVTPTTTNAQLATWVTEGAVSVTATAQLGIVGNALQLDGGGLTYLGAGETSTKPVNVSFRGGTITSSGTGALVLSATTIGNTNAAVAVGDSATVAGGSAVTNLYGVTGLSALAAAGKLVVSASNGTTIVAGTTTETINEAARTMDLGAGNTNNVQTSGNGAPLFTFTANAAINRTLTLAGTNTAANTISGAITNDATLGGTVGITKSGVGSWVLSGANTYTGVTTVKAGSLTVTNTAKDPILTNAGGADIQGGKLVLDYTGGTSSVAAIKTILDTNFATGFAAGQIRSTTRAAGTTLGYGDDGVSQTTIRVTLAGDADLDGDVDFNDFLKLQSNFGGSGTRFDQGNFNYDGATNFNDFLLLQGNFGQSVSPDSVASYTAAQYAQVMAITSASAVPEPTALAVLGLGAAGLIGRRRRA